ncbi:MAG: diguanylate cyclase [Xanthobacteraceae bacterium]
MTIDWAHFSTCLDVSTLFVISTCVTAQLGLVLLFAWLQERHVRALAWWGLAYLIGGVSVAVWNLQGIGALLLPPAMPSALLFVTCGIVWSGARLFQERRVLPLAMCTGAVVWVIAWQSESFANSGAQHIILSSVIIASYTFLTAFEFCRERRKPLFSRWSALLVPILHGAIFLFPIPIAMLAPVEPTASVFANGWFALFALETLLYANGTAFIMLMTTKERTAQVHKTAASTDPLTGLLNRRAFLEAAQRLIADQARKDQLVSVLMFDLDNFKSINDRFGHALGDDALRLFSATTQANMRSSDLIGRLGGEEFAAILPGTLAEAVGVAERVRLAFEVAGGALGGHVIGATVSIGAACEPARRTDLPQLLEAADRALYRAKGTGRNRVQAVPSGEVVPFAKVAAPGSSASPIMAPAIQVAQAMRLGSASAC